MQKFVVLSGIAVSIWLGNAAEAGIFGRRWSRPTYSNSNAPSNYYFSAPASRPAAPASTANAGTGYRSYSRQPNPNEPAEFQQGNPAYGYPTQQYRNETGEPFHDAGANIRGR